MIHRLNKIPLSPDNYKTELETIKYMAQTNGYNTTLIDKLNHKIKTKLQSNLNTNTEMKPYITITYFNQHSYKIARTFKKAGYNIAYRTQNRIKSALSSKTTDTNVRPVCPM